MCADCMLLFRNLIIDRVIDIIIDAFLILAGGACLVRLTGDSTIPDWSIIRDDYYHVNLLRSLVRWLRNRPRGNSCVSHGGTKTIVIRKRGG